MALPNDFDDQPSWGNISPAAPGDILRDAMRKDTLIKEIVAAQEDLKAIITRVHAIQDEVDQLTSGNEMLQTYIENLSKQIGKG